MVMGDYSCQEVVGSNPSAVYLKDLTFFQIVAKIVLFF